MSIRKYSIIISLLLTLFPPLSWGQSADFGLLHRNPNNHVMTIDRKALVRRHNPQTHHVGQQQFLVGIGNAQMKVDATALQTFIGDSGNMVNIGLDIPDTTHLSQLTMELDRWTGKATSRFYNNGRFFHVETVYTTITDDFDYQLHRKSIIAVRITSDSIFDVILRPQEAALQGKLQSSDVKSLKKNAAFQLRDEAGTHWFAACWRGNTSMKKSKGQMRLHCKGDEIVVEGKKQKQYVLDIIMYPMSSKPSDWFYNTPVKMPFTEYALHAAAGWANFWNECGIADFSATNTPEAKAMERHLVETLYDFSVDTPSDWWSQAPLTAYGFAKQIVPILTMKSRRSPDELSQKPEFIAASLLTLRAYTMPQVIERFNMDEETVGTFYATIYNAFVHVIKKAGESLESNQSAVPDYLDRDELLSVARRWLVAPESLELLKPSAGKMFHLPMASDQLPGPLFLLAIADHRWPQDWKVTVENILPLP